MTIIASPITTILQEDKVNNISKEDSFLTEIKYKYQDMFMFCSSRQKTITSNLETTHNDCIVLYGVIFFFALSLFLLTNCCCFACRLSLKTNNVRLFACYIIHSFTGFSCVFSKFLLRVSCIFILFSYIFSPTPYCSLSIFQEFGLSVLLSPAYLPGEI